MRDSYGGSAKGDLISARRERGPRMEASRLNTRVRSRSRSTAMLASQRCRLAGRISRSPRSEHRS